MTSVVGGSSFVSCKAGQRRWIAKAASMDWQKHGSAWDLCEMRLVRRAITMYAITILDLLLSLCIGRMHRHLHTWSHPTNSCRVPAWLWCVQAAFFTELAQSVRAKRGGVIRTEDCSMSDRIVAAKIVVAAPEHIKHMTCPCGETRRLDPARP